VDPELMVPGLSRAHQCAVERRRAGPQFDG
jgi:hypothetical protein